MQVTELCTPLLVDCRRILWQGARLAHGRRTALEGRTSLAAPAIHEVLDGE